MHECFVDICLKTVVRHGQTPVNLLILWLKGPIPKELVAGQVLKVASG